MGWGGVGWGVVLVVWKADAPHCTTQNNKQVSARYRGGACVNSKEEEFQISTTTTFSAICRLNSDN